MVPNLPTCPPNGRSMIDGVGRRVVGECGATGRIGRSTATFTPDDGRIPPSAATRPPTRYFYYETALSQNNRKISGLLVVQVLGKCLVVMDIEVVQVGGEWDVDANAPICRSNARLAFDVLGCGVMGEWRASAGLDGFAATLLPIAGDYPPTPQSPHHSNFRSETAY